MWIRWVFVFKSSRSKKHSARGFFKRVDPLTLILGFLSALWYSQKVLPGGGLNIPGRHVDNNGYVCDENGFICLASGSLAKGTIVETPFGKKGKVYDCGCAANTLDVYTNF